MGRTRTGRVSFRVWILVVLKPSFSLQAPAKLNLGLEILGKRADGYHDLATIFVAVSLFDTLTFAPSPTLHVECSDPDLSGGENLVQGALVSAQGLAQSTKGAQITVHKRIPLAAGLGGASSDAATALIGCQRFWNTRFIEEQLRTIGLALGSDVPFFLRGGCALGHGRGERLRTLRLPAQTWFVLVAPDILIGNKTASMFRELRPSDFSEGVRIAQQAESLETTGMLDTSLLTNAFARPVYERVPALEEIAATMRAAGASHVAVTGAGPTHYSVERDLEHARFVAASLQSSLGSKARILLVRAVAPRDTSDLFSPVTHETDATG